MASFHHRITRGTKGNNKAQRHANYITRSGQHRAKNDLLASGTGNLPDWAQDDPKRFWREADKHERKNGAVYREHEIALPSELTHEQLHELAKIHMNELIGNKPYQYAIHCPTSSIGGVPHPHLHLMYSDRMHDGISRSPAQMFARYNPEHPSRGGARKDSGGKTSMELRDQVITTRKKIAEAQNRALTMYGHAARVDHRTLRAQGLDRKPERRYALGQIKQMSPDEKARIVQARLPAPTVIEKIAQL